MAIFSGIAAAIGGVFSAVSGFIGGLGAVGGFLLKTAVGVGLNLLAQAIAGKPDQPVFGIQGKLQTGGDLPRSIIFGRTATAGSLVYANTWGRSGKTPNAYLTQVIALTDLPIGGLVEFWVNGQKVTIDYSDTSYAQGFPVQEFYNSGSGNNLWIRFYDGTQTAADPFLVSQFGSDGERPWQATRVGRGVAYAIVTAQVQEYLFTGFPQYKFTLDGMRLYDPSRDTSVGGSGPQRWDNPATWGGDGDHLPAVQIYNLLRGIRYNGQWIYGLQGVTAPRLPAAVWIEQINKCRALIDGPDGPEATYRTGGEIHISAPVSAAIEAILTGCQGRLAETGGTYNIHVGAPDPVSFAFTDDEILSTEEQTFTPFFGLADTINGITSTYPNPEEGWVPKAAPPLYRTDLETLAGDRRLMADVSLDFVPYKGQVQRLMKSALEEAQRARRHTLVLPPEFWTIEPGDYVQWSSERNGYIDKIFRVDGVIDGASLDIVIDITEVDPSDYDWDQSNDYKEPVDGPVGPIRPAPQMMTGWQVQPYTILDGSGKPRRPAIEVFFDGDLIDVAAVRIQVRDESTGLLVLDGDHPYGDPDTETKSVVVSGNSILPATLYEVRGRYIPYSDRATEWSSWLPVTTPNVLLGADDVDFGDISEFVSDATEWIGWNTRETIERARRNILLDIDQDAANYLDKQELRREASTDNARFYESIVLLSGEQSGLAQRLEELEVTVENDIASAVNLLTVEISNVDGRVTANATSIQALTAQVDDVASSVTIRGETMASPGGGWSRYGVEVKTGIGDDWSSAAFFLDAQPGMSRVVFIADQFVITNGSATVAPFVFQGATAYLENARIGDLRFDRLRSNNGKLDINGFGNNAYIAISN